MEIVILGSGTAVQFQQRASSCYLLKLQEVNILLDAGFYVVERLEQANISIADLDYIFISHKHPDHFIGIIHILFALRNPFYKRKKPIKIFGFKGLKDYFDHFQKILGQWIKPEIDILFYEDENNNFSDFSCSTFKTKHSEESVGIKIFSNEKVIVYTSDTEFFPELTDEIKDADLLIIECASSSKNRLKGHLSYNEIESFTKDLNIKKIILTHFYPNSIPEKDIKNNFIIGNDLMTIKINWND